MAGLEKSIIDVSLAGGIDTKTNQKLVQGKLLELVNAEMENGIISKSSGYSTLAQSDTSNIPTSYFQSITTSYQGQLQLIANNSVYSYASNTDKLTKTGELNAVDRNDLVLSSNIRYEINDSVQAWNSRIDNTLCSGEYGTNLVVAYTESPSNGNNNIVLYGNGKYNNIRVVDKTDNSVINSFSFNPSYNTVIEEVICSPFNFCILTTEMSSPSIVLNDISRKLYLFRYTETAPFYNRTLFTISNKDPAGLYGTNIRGDNPVNYKRPGFYFHTIRGVYANNNYYVAYLEPKDVDNNGEWWVQLAVIDSQSGTLLSSVTNTSSILGKGTDGIYAGNYGYRRGDATFSFSISHMIINNQSTICLSLGRLSFKLYTGTNTLTLSKSVPVPPSSAYSDGGTDIVMMTYDTAYVADRNSIALLCHGFREDPTPKLGTSAPDDKEYFPYAPKILFYNLTTDAWDISQSLPSLPLHSSINNWYPYFGYNSVVYGIAHIASGIIMINNVPCFVLSYAPYVSNANDFTTDDPLITRTSGKQRRCTLFLMDYKYNVIDKIVDYDAGLLKYIVNSYTDLTQASFPLVLPRNSSSKLSSEISLPYLVEKYGYKLGVTTFSSTPIDKSVYELRLIKYNWPRISPISNLTNNKTSYIVSNIIRSVDSKLYESSFFDFPQLIVSKSANSGGLDLTKVYQYCAVYVWTSPTGEFVRSSPSIIQSSIATTGTGEFKVMISYPPYFSKRKDVSIEVYRSKGNGSVLYQIATLNQVHAFGDTSDQSNLDSYWQSVLYDSISDHDINGKILYTTGNILPEMQFPSISRAVSHNSRVFAISNLDRNTVLYSKEKDADVALSTFAGLSFVVEPRGGGIVDLASLDDKLIVFKKDYIYFVQGDGAGRTGEGSTLTTPALVNSPVGCSEPNSIVRIPEGLLFKSSKGIYLLDRSLVVTYRGADVEQYNSNTINSAISIPSKNVVKFSTIQGNLICYNYYYNTWNIEDNLPFSSINIYNSKLVGILKTGGLYLNNPSIFTRGSNQYQMKIKTSWLRVTGLQGFQRVYTFRFLGDYKDTHVMNCSVAYDYDDTSLTPHIISTVDTFSPSQPYQFKVYFSRQKCESVQLIFSDTPSNTGQSFTITGLAFIVGVKNGANKLPVNKSSSL